VVADTPDAAWAAGDAATDPAARAAATISADTARGVADVVKARGGADRMGRTTFRRREEIVCDVR